MVFAARKGFDLWSYLMFPGEFASRGDLEARPASRTRGGGSRPEAGGFDKAAACVLAECGLCSLWATSPDGLRLVRFSPLV